MDNFNVLLVDDEVDFLYPLIKRLSKRKLNVEKASGGMDALDIIKKRAVDVVVLDVKMPGMNGIDTLLEIKKYNAMIEVIMLSGHASIDAAIEGMEKGAFDYLVKPVDFDELFFKLQDAFQKKAIQEEKLRKFNELKNK